MSKHKEEVFLKELLFGSPTLVDDKTKRKKDSHVKETDKSAVWRDDEEAELGIDLDSVPRLKKLKRKDENGNIAKTIDGSVLTESLQKRFNARTLDWATPNQSEKTSEEHGLLRKSEALVSSSNNYLLRKYSTAPLQAGKVNIKRLVNANINDPATSSVLVLGFHTSGNVLMSGGEDKHLRFFKVDGEKNEKMLSVKFPHLTIRSASFLGSSSEVFLSGRQPFFHSYDTTSGSVSKINGPLGFEVKSLERMVVAPDGDTACFLGASGYLHLFSQRSKQWSMNLKMNSAARSAVFIGEHAIATSGLDAEIYIWDIRRPGKCLNRFAHDDGTCTSSLGSYSPPSGSVGNIAEGYLSVGTDSGVVSVFKSDGLSSRDGGVTKQIKSLMNLTTRISSSVFHPSGQILAVASNQKQSQLKLVHLPSCSVFSNWPTERTPLGRVESIAFSPQGGYLAVGNNKGCVLLYQLEHFGAA